MNDAGNLQNLNDIVAPGPVAWWPLAPGWYLLLSAGAVVLAVLALRYWRRWRSNAYRRQALRELSSIRGGVSGAGPGQLPELLKRAALSAWRREEVASLSGSAWHRFLDQSAGVELFCSGAGDTLDRLSYAGSDTFDAKDPEMARLFEAAETWLKRHQPAEQGA